MEGKSVKTIILWWGEVIIAIRVLLFSIPVFINKYLAGSFTMADLNDRFIAVLSATALIFLGIGLASIFGYRRWKIIHYYAGFIVLMVTMYSLYTFDQPKGSVGIFYFYPIVFATVIALLTLILGKSKQAV